MARSKNIIPLSIQKLNSLQPQCWGRTHFPESYIHIFREQDNFRGMQNSSPVRVRASEIPDMRSFIETLAKETGVRAQFVPFPKGASEMRIMQDDWRKLSDGGFLFKGGVFDGIREGLKPIDRSAVERFLKGEMPPGGLRTLLQEQSLS
jgi:hypothetical protein